MQFLAVFLFSILAAALQLTLMPRLSILAAAPNLILASVLAWAIWQSEQKKDGLVLIIILMFDLSVGRPFGLLSLNMWLVFWGVEQLGKVFFKRNDVLAVWSLIFIGLLFFELNQFLLSRLLSIWHLTKSADIYISYFYTILPVNLFYNGALSLFLLWILNKNRASKTYGSVIKTK